MNPCRTLVLLLSCSVLGSCAASNMVVNRDYQTQNIAGATLAIVLDPPCPIFVHPPDADSEARSGDSDSLACASFTAQLVTEVEQSTGFTEVTVGACIGPGCPAEAATQVPLDKPRTVILPPHGATFQVTSCDPDFILFVNGLSIQQRASMSRGIDTPIIGPDGMRRGSFPGFDSYWTVLTCACDVILWDNRTGSPVASGSLEVRTSTDFLSGLDPETQGIRKYVKAMFGKTPFWTRPSWWDSIPEMPPEEGI